MTLTRSASAACMDHRSVHHSREAAQAGPLTSGLCIEPSGCRLETPVVKDRNCRISPCAMQQPDAQPTATARVHRHPHPATPSHTCDHSPSSEETIWGTSVPATPPLSSTGR